jgi:hypothetical protein
VVVPRFKIWIDIQEVPADCSNEEEIAKSFTHFGTYLGTIELEAPSDLSTWSLVLATTDLAAVPKTVSFMVGGIEMISTLRARR